MLTRTRAEELLHQMSGRRVLVLGDLMLDGYVYGSVDRISPEAPVPVVHVTREAHVPGGACNVAANIRALGGAAFVAGVVGDDDHGNRLIGGLNRNGIDTSTVVIHESWSTIVKTRIIADRQQVCRVDHERGSMPADLLDHLAEELPEAIDHMDGLIIEDYGKGVVAQPLVDLMIGAGLKRGIPVGFDPKDNHDLIVKGVTLATPNRKEAWHAARASEAASTEQVGRALLQAWEPDVLLLTLGPEGMELFQRDQEAHVVPTRAREVFDVSGAGDTVIATSLLAMAAGAKPIEAAELANYAAGVVVAKLGTATCSPNEILESLP